MMVMTPRLMLVYKWTAHDAVPHDCKEEPVDTIQRNHCMLLVFL